MIEGELYGLYESTNGRSCEIHQCCGECLQVNDLVLFKPTTVEIDEVEEVAIAAHIVKEGTILCRVGFIPRVMVIRYGLQSFEKKFAQIQLLYKYSDNRFCRKLDHEKRGIAKFCVLNNELIDYQTG